MSETHLASPRPSYPRVLHPTVDWLRAMLRHVNPHSTLEERDRLVRAVHQATSGSDEGLAMADLWYRARSDYPGYEALCAEWKSLQHGQESLDGFAALCGLVEGWGFEWEAICDSCEPQFATCDYLIIDPDAEPRNVLTTYSLRGESGALEREAVLQVLILMGLGLLGQAMVFYAAPNTGKTLLTLWLIIESIKRGLLIPARVFYVNLDDSMAGLIDKLHLAERHGFHMLAEGYRDFKASVLLRLLTEMSASGQAKRVVVVIDTTKKLVDIMNKGESTFFGKIVRRFVLRGGTVVLLAHTNKRLGPDGRPIYAGTTDILEDVDCAYTLQVTSEHGAREKVVAFENIKRRGDVRQRAVYGYSAADGLSYEELLDTVRPIGDDEVCTIQQAERRKSDADLMRATCDLIRAGTNIKMVLAHAIAQRTGCSKRMAIRVLEKYTGNDPKKHYWHFEIKARGAKVYHLIPRDEADSNGPH